MSGRRKRIASFVLAPLLVSACAAPALSATPVPTPAAPIDLVALGDSTPAAFRAVDSYVDYYAQYIAEDLGVSVQVHTFARNGERASDLLTNLQRDEALREAIREADVITIWTGFNDIYPAIGIDPQGATCGPWADLDLECVGERSARLRSAIDGIVATVLQLVDPAETLILFADVGNPLANQWAGLGLLEELKGPVMESWITHVSGACEGSGIRVVHTYRELNGPDGMRVVDPEILQDDGLHFNAKGHRLVADIHRRVGYGPLGGDREALESGG